MTSPDPFHGPLLAIKPCPAVPTAELDSPGFAWWYADLVDHDGNGAVVIGAFGLPFLPGLASGDRRGAPTLARDRPSLNVAVYRNHRRAAYFLQEHPVADCSWSETVQTFGASTFRSVTDGGTCAVEIDLDMVIPGSRERLLGTLRGEGTAPGHTAGEQGPHGWTVLSTGKADIDLRVGAQPLLQTTGGLYHDSNWSTRPLHALDISRWIWARIADELGDLVVWILWPDDPERPPMARLFRAGALMVEVPCEMSVAGEQKGLFGMSAPRTIRLDLGEVQWTLRLVRCVDDGFFYQRWLLEGEGIRPGTAHGTCELIAPHQVDLGRHRPLVQMAHHRLGQRNSMWLPLFNGPRQDRWRRLLRWWWG